MTIDTKIIPLCDVWPSWAEIKHSIVEFAPESNRSALGRLQLADYQTNRSLEGTERMEPNRAYCFLSDVTNTLSVYIGSKDGVDSDEETIEDEGGRLNASERRAIIERWSRVPYWIHVSSGPLRSASEARSIGYFSAGVAAAFGGYISSFEGSFSVEPGMYRPEEFAEAILLGGP